MQHPGWQVHVRATQQMMIKFFSVLGLVLLATPAMAQERTAGSSLDTQMTWSGLSSQITTVKQRADSAHIRVDQVEVCGRKGMVYSPGNGADGQGCVTPATAADVINQLTNLKTNVSTINTSLTNTTKNIHNCAVKGQSFNGKSCVTTTHTEEAAPDCRLAAKSAKTVNGGAGIGSSNSGTSPSSLESQGYTCMPTGTSCQGENRENRCLRETTTYKCLKVVCK
jgi:hypothetical protein